MILSMDSAGEDDGNVIDFALFGKKPNSVKTNGFRWILKVSQKCKKSLQVNWLTCKSALLSL